MLFEWLLTAGMPAGMAGGSYGIWDIWGSRCQVSTPARGPGSYCRSMLFIDFSISIDFFFFFFFKTCFQPTASILILCIWFNQYFLFAILITWFILSHFYHTIFSYWFYQSRQCLSCCNRLSAFGFQSLPMILWSVSADPISKIMLMLIILELPFEFASSFQRLISNRLKDFNWQFCLWQVMSAALITLPILKV